MNSELSQTLYILGGLVVAIQVISTFSVRNSAKHANAASSRTSEITDRFVAFLERENERNDKIAESHDIALAGVNKALERSVNKQEEMAKAHESASMQMLAGFKDVAESMKTMVAEMGKLGCRNSGQPE